MSEMYLPNLVHPSADGGNNFLATMMKLEKDRREEERLRLATKKQNELLGLQSEKARLDIEEHKRKSDPESSENLFTRGKHSAELLEKELKLSKEADEIVAKALPGVDLRSPKEVQGYNEWVSKLPFTSSRHRLPISDLVDDNGEYIPGGYEEAKRRFKTKVRTVESVNKENKPYTVTEGEEIKTYRDTEEGPVEIATTPKHKPEPKFGLPYYDPKFKARMQKREDTGEEKLIAHIPKDDNEAQKDFTLHREWEIAHKEDPIKFPTFTSYVEWKAKLSTLQMLPPAGNAAPAVDVKKERVDAETAIASGKDPVKVKKLFKDRTGQEF